MRFEVKVALWFGLLPGLLLGFFLPRLLPSIERELARTVELPPVVFWPVWALATGVAVWTQARQTRELYRQCVARAKGASHLGVAWIVTLVVGALSYWFIAN